MLAIPRQDQDQSRVLDTGEVYSNSVNVRPLFQTRLNNCMKFHVRLQAQSQQLTLKTQVKMFQTRLFVFVVQNDPIQEATMLFSLGGMGNFVFMNRD